MAECTKCEYRFIVVESVLQWYKTVHSKYQEEKICEFFCISHTHTRSSCPRS